MSAATVVLFPLTLASNVFVAPHTMPGWLQAFVAVNPSATWSPPSAPSWRPPGRQANSLGAARLHHPRRGVRPTHSLALRQAAVSAVGTGQVGHSTAGHPAGFAAVRAWVTLSGETSLAVRLAVGQGRAFPC